MLAASHVSTTVDDSLITLSIETKMQGRRLDQKINMALLRLEVMLKQKFT